jgi:predicted dehydrogenase
MITRASPPETAYPSEPEPDALLAPRPTVLGFDIDAAELRIGVVGVGARGPLATWAHRRQMHARVVAVADPHPAAGRRARKLFGPGVDVVDSHHELISMEPRLDAVFVMSPDYTHAEVTSDLLRAGIPVYLEKPMATTVEDADRVLAIARETGTRLYVGHNMRHMAVVSTMFDIIERGEIGEVKAIWCRHFVGNGGDFYFKDWHADRRRSKGLLVQKGVHDIDVIHYLAGAYTKDVVGMGDLVLYGGIDDHRDNSDQLMQDWLSLDHWPPSSQTALNPVVDVEDLSMVTMRLSNGVLASYQQCHFTPDYWRNYTVIGTHGRLENFGDADGGIVRVWNRRTWFSAEGDLAYRVSGDAAGHDDADERTVSEFLHFVRTGDRTATSPVSARYSVAAGILATDSLRSGSVPLPVPRLPVDVEQYFADGQSTRTDATIPSR